MQKLTNIQIGTRVGMGGGLVQGGRGCIKFLSLKGKGGGGCLFR